jgi:hypothetical protein
MGKETLQLGLRRGAGLVPAQFKVKRLEAGWDYLLLLLE